MKKCETKFVTGAAEQKMNTMPKNIILIHDMLIHALLH
jgi:hypothetical protein